MMRKTAASILAIMLSIVLLPSVKVLAMEEATVPAAGEVLEEEESLVDKDDLTGMTRDEIIAYTEELIRGEDGNENYKLTVEDDQIILDLWFDETSSYAEQAKTDSTYKEGWDYTVEAMRDMTEALYNMYSRFDTDVHVYVVDENDHNNILIYCFNGTKVYDCVNDADMGFDINRTRR